MEKITSLLLKIALSTFVIAFVIAIFGLIFELDYDGLAGQIFKILAASAFIETVIALIISIFRKLN